MLQVSMFELFNMIYESAESSSHLGNQNIAHNTKL